VANKKIITKRSLIIRFLSLVGILLLLNILSTRLHKRMDLTDDNRFSISKATKDYLKTIKDPINIKVLLDGKMPSNYEKLRTATADVLSTFNEESKGKVTFSFENPMEGKSMDEKIKLNEDYKKKGIFGVVTNPTMDEDNGVEQRIVFPYAVISGGGREQSFCLQQTKSAGNNETTVDDLLNYSESLMEYNIIDAIRNITKAEKESIAYVVGHGEPDDYKILHLLFLASQKYKVDTVNLNNVITIPYQYKACIINGPKRAFTDKEKLVLDQYIMGDGRTLWLIDGVDVNSDTLMKSPSYTAMPRELNLNDQLYKYGVRINNNLVEDRQCAKLMVQVGIIDGKADFRPFDWVYYPLCIPTSKHPIVNNMDPVWMRYASSIDTINNGDNKKTILFESSNFSRTIASPGVVSLNSLKIKPKMSVYNKKYIPMAVALEGKFNSVFANRLSPEQMKIYQEQIKLTFRNSTEKPNKMIVVADGDFLLNDRMGKNSPTEMAFDKYTEHGYANSVFALNALEWLVDETGLLEARNKDVQLRTLNPDKARKYRTQYQILNIAAPIAVTIFIGLLWFYMRKLKYQKALK
jgi:ABC-2 type transport system permease protein